MLNDAPSVSEKENTKRHWLLKRVAEEVSEWPASKDDVFKQTAPMGFEWHPYDYEKKWRLAYPAGAASDGEVTYFYKSEWIFMREWMGKSASGADKMRAHYQYGLRMRLNREDMERGYVELSLDPYTIGELYKVGGGPREQVMKKSLRGTSKGQTEQELVDDIQSALDRWREKLREREYIALIRPTS